VDEAATVLEVDEVLSLIPVMLIELPHALPVEIGTPMGGNIMNTAELSFPVPSTRIEVPSAVTPPRVDVVAGGSV
jgi:hypothetical protein